MPSFDIYKHKNVNNNMAKIKKVVRLQFVKHKTTEQLDCKNN